MFLYYSLDLSKQARLWCGSVTPFLQDGFLHFLGVCLGPGADLLGYLATLLPGHQLGDQLGDVPALPDGLHVAGLDWVLHHHRLHLVPADDTRRLDRRRQLQTLRFSCATHILETAPLRSTDLLGLLGALRLGRVLLHLLPLDGAPLHRPLVTLLPGDVSLRHVVALHHLLRLAGGDIVLHLKMHLMRVLREKTGD